MKQNPFSSSQSGMGRFSGLRGVAPTVLAALVGAFTLVNSGCKPATTNEGVQLSVSEQLSPGTLAVLAGLKMPVEIHYYAVLDKSTVAGPTQIFAERVGRLLALYQQSGGDHLQVKQVTDFNTANAASAAAEGLQPFNRDKGDDCFLGLTVSCGNEKESIPLLAPEWETAVEADVSRMIARVSTPRLAGSVVAGVKADAATIEALKKNLPDLANLTVEEGTRRLRDKAVSESQKIAQEYARQIFAAQQRYVEAEKNGAATEKQAAQEELLKLQAEQTRLIKEIALNLDAELKALREIKN